MMTRRGLLRRTAAAGAMVLLIAVGPAQAADAAAVQRNVHPGAFCSPAGARGTTTKGTPMRCTKKPGESRARWRAA